jgi:3-hydroxyisobutyrate dehydrogenase
MLGWQKGEINARALSSPISTRSTSMTTIAFLGTGLMGTGFIQRARANGLNVRARNRSAAKAQALAANDAGVTACATVAEAVRGA